MKGAMRTEFKLVNPFLQAPRASNHLLQERMFPWR